MKNYKFRNLFFLTLLGAQVLTTTSCSSDDDDDTQGYWTSASDFDGRDRSGSAAVTIDSKGYLFFGYDGTDQLRDAWVYDIDRNYWTQLPSLPETDEDGNAVKARNTAVAFALNGKCYVGTGNDGTSSAYLADFWEFDPAAGTWAKMPDYPGGARHSATAFSLGNFGYVGTGYDGSTQKDFYSFNGNTKTWSSSAIPFNGAKRKGAITFIIDNKAYLFGGSSSSVAKADFWRFDQDASSSVGDGTWTELAKITDTNKDANNNSVSWDDDYTTIARDFGVAIVIDGKAYISTGESATGSITRYSWQYDPATDRWDDMTPFGNADYDAASRTRAIGFSNGSKGFIATGKNGTSYMGDIWSFDPYVIDAN